MGERKVRVVPGWSQEGSWVCLRVRKEGEPATTALASQMTRKGTEVR